MSNKRQIRINHTSYIAYLLYPLVNPFEPWPFLCVTHYKNPSLFSLYYSCPMHVCSWTENFCSCLILHIHDSSALFSLKKKYSYGTVEVNEHVIWKILVWTEKRRKRIRVLFCPEKEEKEKEKKFQTWISPWISPEIWFLMMFICWNFLLICSWAYVHVCMNLRAPRISPTLQPPAPLQPLKTFLACYVLAKVTAWL